MMEDATSGFSWTTLCLVTTITAAIVWMFYKRRESPPDGRKQMPVVNVGGILLSYFFSGYGNEIWMKHPGKAMNALSKDRGSVYMLDLFGLKMIVANGYEAIKEVLVTKGTEIAGRHEKYKVVIGNKTGHGILDGNYCDTWKEQRRFSIQNLRTFGFGKRRFETNIQDEIECLLKEFERHSENPFDVRHYFANSVANVICSLVFGKRFDYDDEKFRSLLDTIREFCETQPKLPFGAFQWYLQWLPKVQWWKKTMNSLCEKLFTFCQQEINEHKISYDPDNLRDFIDGYFDGMESNPENSGYCMEQLKHMLFELFFAGSETTATTLQWAMVYMANHQEVQAKVKKELDTVFSDSQLPSLQERHRLPYTEAVLLEIQRLSSVVPLTPMHLVLEDTEVMGLPVTKGQVISCNLYSVNHNAATFPEPEMLRPERFLGEDGTLLRAESDRLILFGLGPRVCLGQQLAKQELFLFFTSIIHRFRITPPPGVEKLSEEGATSITFVPDPFKICATVRC